MVGRILVNDTTEYLSLEEAKNRFDIVTNEIDTSIDTRIHVIKVAPGLGKTEWAKNQKGVVIAFPDHQLKLEHFNSSRLLRKDEKSFTPNIKEVFSDEVRSKISALYSIGLVSNVSMLIKNLAMGKAVTEDGCAPKIEDTQVAIEYLTHLDVISRSGNNNTIFTTHSRAILGGFKHETIIFDEDPANAIITQHSALISEMKQLTASLVLNGYNAEELLKITCEDDFELPKKTPEFRFGSEILHKLCVDGRFKSQVLNFFRSQFYFIQNQHIYYSINNVNSFDHCKKYIICDATANRALYEGLFGDRLKFYDISNVKNRGEIIQDTSLSCSRTGLDSYCTSVVSKLNLKYETITFKSFKEKIPNSAQDMHFGRVRGSNRLSGINLNVVGNPHYNNNYYKFICASIGLVVTDFKMKLQHVTYNCRTFKFMTYVDKRLQKLHLSTIEGELIQTVHRARLIRTNAVVYLHCSFPLLQAKYIQIGRQS